MGQEEKSDMMSLKARVAQALNAEREKDEGCTTRLSTLRLIDAAIRDRDVCARGRGDSEGCPDADVRNVLDTMIAQRETAAREHDDAGRIEDAIRDVGAETALSRQDRIRHGRQGDAQSADRPEGRRQVSSDTLVNSAKGWNKALDGSVGCTLITTKGL